MAIYIPKYFKAFELVDRATYEKFGEDSLRYFRPEIMRALDWIRENYPAPGERIITVNYWHEGGAHEWRGLRGPACPEYNRWSAHSVGAAIDFQANGCTDGEMRQWIREEHHEAGMHGIREGIADDAMDFPVLNIRRMEIGTVGWVHIDCLEHEGDGILMVSP